MYRIVTFSTDSSLRGPLRNLTMSAFNAKIDFAGYLRAIFAISSVLSASAVMAPTSPSDTLQKVGSSKPLLLFFSVYGITVLLECRLSRGLYGP